MEVRAGERRLTAVLGIFFLGAGGDTGQEPSGSLWNQTKVCETWLGSLHPSPPSA